MFVLDLGLGLFLFSFYFIFYFYFAKGKGRTINESSMLRLNFVLVCPRKGNVFAKSGFGLGLGSVDWSDNTLIFPRAI